MKLKHLSVFGLLALSYDAFSSDLPVSGLSLTTAKTAGSLDSAREAYQAERIQQWEDLELQDIDQRLSKVDGLTTYDTSNRYDSEETLEKMLEDALDMSKSALSEAITATELSTNASNSAAVATNKANEAQVSANDAIALTETLCDGLGGVFKSNHTEVITIEKTITYASGNDVVIRYDTGSLNFGTKVYLDGGLLGGNSRPSWHTGVSPSNHWVKVYFTQYQTGGDNSERTVTKSIQQPAEMGEYNLVTRSGNVISVMKADYIKVWSHSTYGGWDGGTFTTDLDDWFYASGLTTQYGIPVIKGFPSTTQLLESKFYAKNQSMSLPSNHGVTIKGIFSVYIPKFCDVR